MKKLFHLAFAIGFAGMCFTACAGYSAQDYVNDMKSLTEKTLKNASSYTEEDWKRVGEEYRSINEKGKKGIGGYDRRPAEGTGKVLGRSVGKSRRVQS